MSIPAVYLPEAEDLGWLPISFGCISGDFACWPTGVGSLLRRCGGLSAKTRWMPKSCERFIESLTCFTIRREADPLGDNSDPSARICPHACPKSKATAKIPPRVKIWSSYNHSFAGKVKGASWTTSLNKLLTLLKRRLKFVNRGPVANSTSPR